MPFFDQVLELLSQFPGNLIYHFGILFAIEATLGIALGHRKWPAVRRMAMAAGGMLVVRLALVIVALLDSQQLVVDLPAILPPLERLADTIGVWLLIWAFLPLFNRMPQWGDLLAGCIALLVMVLYVFFAVAWYSDAPSATVAYNNSYQDAVWEAIQLGLLGTACGYLLISRQGDWGLQLGILLTLLGVHVVHYGWASSDENVAVWVRLGQVVAYPLLAVSTYRLVLRHLLKSAVRPPERAAVDLVEPIKQVTALSSITDEVALNRAAVSAVARITEANAVSLLLVTDLADRIEVEQVAVYSHGNWVPNPRETFDLDEAPALRRAVSQKQPILLRPDGADDLTRLSLLVQLMPEAPLDERLGSSLLIQPVSEDSFLYGVMLVATDPSKDEEEWAVRNRQLVDLLAMQLAATLSKVRVYWRMKKQVADLGSQVGKLDPETAGRMEQLHHELSEARHSERDLARQLDDAQQELTRTRQRMEDLATLVEQHSGQSEAMVALSDLSKQQKKTITKLEARLKTLEGELNQIQTAAGNGRESHPQSVSSGRELDAAVVGQAIEELRKPIASLVGYADLLLGESMGSIGDLQKVFLQRVKASSERAQVLLDDLVVAADADNELIELELVPANVADMVEQALERLTNLVARKELKLDLDVQRLLPMLEVDPSVLDQILYKLLDNAFQSSAEQGAVTVEVRFQDSDHLLEVEGGRSGYLFFSVTDSGQGIALDVQKRVFDRAYRCEHPQIEGLADGGKGLPLAGELVKAHGGRVWLESETGVGSTVSLVLPVKVAESQA